MFERAHHQRIAKLLLCFDQSVLERTSCFFGGGTAIALSLDEYRESVDVDFLCASKEGYRELRNTVSQSGLGSMFRAPVVYAREVIADMYGIRTRVVIDGVPIKIEVISEGRIALERSVELAFPTLCRRDLFAEKLLANADRALDNSTSSRDIIDLAMMISKWGPIPSEALEKARAAYGDSIDVKWNQAVSRIRDPGHLARCLTAMKMDLALAPHILDSFRIEEGGQDVRREGIGRVPRV